MNIIVYQGIGNIRSRCANAPLQQNYKCTFMDNLSTLYKGSVGGSGDFHNIDIKIKLKFFHVMVNSIVAPIKDGFNNG